MQKINIIIIAIFFLIVGFGFAWADIDVENVLKFELDPAQDDMIIFKPPGATMRYSLGINAAGEFIIAQIIAETVFEKFRITPSGDVYITGSIATGTIPWASVSVSADCAATGTALTGIDANGVLTCGL